MGGRFYFACRPHFRAVLSAKVPDGSVVHDVDCLGRGVYGRDVFELPFELAQHLRGALLDGGLSGPAVADCGGA